MEISNKTLAWMVVAAIVVSFAGTLFSLNVLEKTNMATGFATQSNTTAGASVQISSQTSLDFVVSALSFGSGSINTSQIPYGCTMYINKTTSPNIQRSTDCDGFSSTNSFGALTLENTGNTHLNVTLNFSSNASDFMDTAGGTGSNANSSLRFSVVENESLSCKTLNVTTASWTEVNQNAVYTVCNGLDYNNANDSLSVGIYVTIPPDASGSKSLTITAQGTG